MGTGVMLPKIPVFADIFENIGKGIMDALLSLVWLILQGLMWILDGLQSAFFFITGVEKMTLNMNGKEVEVTLLELMFGISNNGQSLDFSMPLHKVYIGMLGVFAIIFVFFIVCAIVKIQINRENKENLPSMRKMLWKSATAFFIVILLPIIFCLLLSFAGIFMESIINLLKFNLLSGDSDLTISECLFKASVDSNKVAELIGQDKIISWYEDPINKTGGISYKQLISDYGEGGVSFVLLLISVCCCLIGLAMSVITVAERLINIAMLYVIAPVVIASIPLDDGKRWESWKDTTTVKILTAAANVISIYLFIYVMKEFGNIILSGQTNFVLSLVYIVIAISGAFGCAKAGTFIANIISANAGQQEGMSFLGNSAMLKMAGALAGGALKAAGGLLGLKSKQDQKNNSNSGGGSDGSGSDGGGSETAHTRDDQNPADSYNQSRQLAARQNARGGGDAGGDSQEASGGSDGGTNLGVGAAVGAAAGAAAGGIGKTLGNIMSAPLKAFNATKNALGKVGQGIKGAASYISVPGALKLAGGAIAGVATGVTAAVAGGKALYDKIKGKKTKVDRSTLGGMEKNPEVKSAVNTVEQQSRRVEKAGRPLGGMEKKLQKQGAAIKKTQEQIEKKKAAGKNTDGLENKLIKQVGSQTRQQMRLDGQKEILAIEKGHQQKNQERLSQTVQETKQNRENKVDSLKKKLTPGAKPGDNGNGSGGDQ